MNKKTLAHLFLFILEHAQCAFVMREVPLHIFITSVNLTDIPDLRFSFCIESGKNQRTYLTVLEYNEIQRYNEGAFVLRPANAIAITIH